MAKYFRIQEIDSATFNRMTGKALDCLQVATLADDGNLYLASKEYGQEYLVVSLKLFDTDGSTENG